MSVTLLAMLEGNLEGSAKLVWIDGKCSEYGRKLSHWFSFTPTIVCTLPPPPPSPNYHVSTTSPSLLQNDLLYFSSNCSELLLCHAKEYLGRDARGHGLSLQLLPLDTMRYCLPWQGGLYLCNSSGVMQGVLSCFFFSCEQFVKFHVMLEHSLLMCLSVPMWMPVFVPALTYLSHWTETNVTIADKMVDTLTESVEHVEVSTVQRYSNKIADYCHDSPRYLVLMACKTLAPSPW